MLNFQFINISDSLAKTTQFNYTFLFKIKTGVYISYLEMYAPCVGACVLLFVCGSIAFNNSALKQLNYFCYECIHSLSSDAFLRTLCMHKLKMRKTMYFGNYTSRAH